MSETRQGETALAPLRARAMEAVTTAFENDLIGVEELERRMALAKRSGSDLELQGLIAASEAPHPRLVEQRPARSSALALFGSAHRSGRWTMPTQLNAAALFGSVEIDLREAQLGPDSELNAIAVFGSVEILVPPDVEVEVEGVGILGSFEDRSDSPEPGSTPRIRVTGLALLGSVEVRTRLPKESAREARKRRRRAQKALPAKRARS